MLNLNQLLPVLSLTVLTVLLSIISIQIIMILKDIKRTLGRANALLDSIESTVDKLSHPTQSLGGLVSGVREGLRLFDTFSHFLSNRPNKYTQDAPPYES